MLLLTIITDSHSQHHWQAQPNHKQLHAQKHTQPQTNLQILHHLWPSPSWGSSSTSSTGAVLRQCQSSVPRTTGQPVLPTATGKRRYFPHEKMRQMVCCLRTKSIILTICDFKFNVCMFNHHKSCNRWIN